MSARQAGIEAAIFDLDGTLLDSMDIWNHLAEDYVLSLGLQPEEGLSGKLAAMSVSAAAGYLQQAYGLSLSLEEIELGIFRQLSLFYREQVPLKPGMKELLAHLAEEGISLCVATLTDETLARAALRRLGVLHYFEEVLSSVQTHCEKLNGNLYRLAAQKLDVPAEKTAVFEDSFLSLRAAKDAGFVGVMVPDASEPLAGPMAALADYAAEDPASFAFEKRQSRKKSSKETV